MHILARLLLPTLAVSLPLSVLADPWKDEGGHGKGHGHGGHPHKETYWDGNCKVERKYHKHGEIKEKRKCKEPQAGYYQPAPVYVAPPPVPVQPGVTIHGTVRLP